MKIRDLMGKACNQLEGTDQRGFKRNICGHCKAEFSASRLRLHQYICPECGHYFRISARRRILMLTDPRSFFEIDGDMESTDPLEFPEYREKLSQAQRISHEKEGVVCGFASIQGRKCGIFAMEGSFMMGSMGMVVGEKITRLFEEAGRRRLAVIGVTVSGGARMQEGMLSLMQMAKISAAVRQHSNQGLCYIVLLTDPTTGGVSASFAMQGDYILAEPGARVGFAGPRVIEQTLREKLPEDFQKAETVLEWGFIDAIAPREKQREILGNLLYIQEEIN